MAKIKSLSIQANCFSNSQLLNSIDLSHTSYVNSNMSFAFNNCQQLTYVSNISNKTTSLSSAFQNCISLRTAPTIPNSVTSLSWTFDNCFNLITPPTIPNSVTYLSGTFFNCRNMTSAPNIPSSVTNMYMTFYYCNNITTINADFNGAVNLSYAFSHLPNLQTTNFSIEKNCITLERAFDGCYNLVTLPSMNNAISLADINYMCESANNIAGDIYMGSPEITIINTAFYGTKQKNVYIPFNSVTYDSFINAGYDENGTKNGVYLKPHPDFTSQDNWLISKSLGTAIKYNGNEENVTIPNSISNTQINSYMISAIKGNTNIKTFNTRNLPYYGAYDNAFYNCYNLTEQPSVFNSELSYINTFRDCHSIQNITIDGSCTDLNSTFRNCYSVNYIHFNSSHNNHHNLANTFRNCYNLKEVYNFDSSDIYTWDNAFRNCTNLIDIHMNTINGHYMYNTFRDCHNLSSVPEPYDSIYYASCTYMNCYNLVNAPKNISVGPISSLFKNCHSLEVASNIYTNGSSLTNMFYGCYNLKQLPNINMSSTLTSMVNTYYDCYSMQGNFTIPNSVVYLSGAYYNCSNLVGSATIPSNVSYIDNTFYNCKGLTNVSYIGTNVSNISNTFYGCNNLTGNIYIHSENITNVQGCFDNTSLEKDVFIPMQITNAQNISLYQFTSYDNTYTVYTKTPSVSEYDDIILYDENGLKLNMIGHSYWNTSSFYVYMSSETEDDEPSYESEEEEYMYEYEGEIYFSRNSAGDIQISHQIGDNTLSYNTFINAGYSASTRKNGVLLKDYSVLFNIHSNVDDYNLYINKSFISGTSFKTLPGDSASYIIYKDGYCIYENSVSTTISDANTTKDINIELTTSGDTYSVTVDQESQIQLIYNDIQLKSEISTSSSIIVPENTEINYIVQKEGYSIIKGTLNSTTKSANLTLKPVVITTYNLSYPFTGTGSEKLTNLLTNNQFVTMSASSPRLASIVSGPSSYNIDDGISYGYIQFTTPNTTDTSKLTVSVTAACYSEKNYDVGWIYIGKELTEPENGDMKTSTPSESFGTVLFNSYVTNGTKYNTYTATLEANTTYYLQFRYTKDSGANKFWDRLSITNIQFTDME